MLVSVFRSFAFFGASLLASLLLPACSQEKATDFTSAITPQQWSSGEIVDLVRTSARHPGFEYRSGQPVETMTANEKAILGLAYRYGYLEGGVEKGMKLLNDACTEGQLRACAYPAQWLLTSDDAETDAAGVKILDRICKAGTLTGCYMLTYAYSKGEDLPHDLQKARLYTDLACSDLQQLSCSYAGRHIAAHSPDMSLKLLTESCEVGNFVSCHNIGIGHRDDRYGTDKVQEALDFFAIACANDYIDSCANILWYNNNGFAEPEKLGWTVRKLIKPCERGHASACGELARYHESYTDNRLNQPELFVKYTTLGCAAGSEFTCSWIINAYDEHLGSEALQREALSAMRDICAMGIDEVCRKVAEIDAAAASVDQSDTNTQTEISAEACRLGDGASCRTLGWAYAIGEEGVDQDVFKAEALFLAGCTHGNSSSCVDRGSLYEYGLHGMPTDKAEAIAMYQRACDLRHPMACDQARTARQTLN